MNVIRGYIIAGTNSGCGKTTISLAFMAWLTRNNYSVAPFKIGPDFIDPGHHSRITGCDSRNLDTWMLDKEYNMTLFNQCMQGKDIAIIEGVMGLFDGFSGKSEEGSTAQIAKLLNMPIILIVNAQSMARSAAALLQGFENFDSELKFAGVIFNNLGSENHLNYLTEAIEENIKMPCLGGILRDNKIKITERHLGLVTNDEHEITQTQISHLINIIDKNIDTSRLFSPEIIKQKRKTPHRHNTRNKVAIGIARDKAFCFYYRDNLDILEKSGAELVFFSPLSDKALPDSVSGLYFGGGYPELFAEKLSKNTTLMRQIRKNCQNNMPIYAECGGFMYLCESITTLDLFEYTMSGCFSLKVKMCNKMKALGYREIKLCSDSIVGDKGDLIRGHEFHYSYITPPHHQVYKTVYSITSRKESNTNSEGYTVYQTLGSYIHLHFGSRPGIGTIFIEKAIKFMELKWN